MLITIRRLTLALAASLALLLSAAVTATSGIHPVPRDAGELVVLTWSDYIDPEIVNEFERAHGIRVRFVFFESDDHRSKILAMSGGDGYDLILANGLMLDTYIRRGWFAPLTPERMPNLRHIDKRWRDAYSGARDHAVPYFWGTLGIGYRTDLVPGPLTTWKRFFNPDGELAGHIGMPNASRDVVSMALKSLGHSANTNDPDALRAAEALLFAQQPSVRTYSYVSLSAQSALVRGEVWAAMLYNGDAIALAEHDENIAFVLPEEGGNIWIDYLGIAATARQPELAARFIDYLNDPAVAARNATWVHYASPNRAAREHLPQSHLDDPAIYPDAGQLARSEFYQAMPPKLNRHVKTIMVELRRRDGRGRP